MTFGRGATGGSPFAAGPNREGACKVGSESQFCGVIRSHLVMSKNGSDEQKHQDNEDDKRNIGRFSAVSESFAAVDAYPGSPHKGHARKQISPTEKETVEPIRAPP